MELCPNGKNLSAKSYGNLLTTGKKAGYGDTLENAKIAANGNTANADSTASSY